MPPRNHFSNGEYFVSVRKRMLRSARRRLACAQLIVEAREFHRVKRPRFFPKCRAEWPFLARHPACDQYARKQSKADNDLRDRQAPASHSAPAARPPPESAR